MKKYTAKTVEEAVKLASEDLKIEESELVYEIEEEKKTLFTKKATIAVYEVADIIEYAEEYIKTVINGLGLEVSLQTFYRDGVAKILIETNKNSLIIGKNGSTLQSLNELVKLACNTKFKREVRILLDIGDYKDKKYSKVISLAKRSAKEVLKTTGHKKEIIELKDGGVYVTEKLANKLNLNVDDEITWHVFGNDKWYTTKIVGLNRDPQSQSLTMTRKYAEELGLTYKADSVYTNYDLSNTTEIEGVKTIQGMETLIQGMQSVC